MDQNNERVQKAFEKLLSPELYTKMNEIKRPIKLHGVYKHKSSDKWFAQVRVLGKNHHIGMFNSQEEAYKERRFVQFRMEQHPSQSMFAWMNNKKGILVLASLIANEDDGETENFYLRGFEMTDEQREAILNKLDNEMRSVKFMKPVVQLQDHEAKVAKIKSKSWEELTDEDMEYVNNTVPLPKDVINNELKLRDLYYNPIAKRWVFTYKVSGIVYEGKCFGLHMAVYEEIITRAGNPAEDD
jgi:hypothetical protein